MSKLQRLCQTLPLLALTAIPSLAQPPAQTSAPVLTYRIQWPAQAIPDITITLALDESGRGTYFETPASADTEAKVRPLHLSPKLQEQIEPAAEVLRSGAPCAVTRKGLAFTGDKTLSLSGSAPAQCKYIYSDDKRIQEAESTFHAIAETMRIGPQLDHEHRFDRLGLDKTIHALEDEVKNGQAVGLENIAASLQSLLDDPLVLERVRLVAKDLLVRAVAGQ